MNEPAAPRTARGGDAAWADLSGDARGYFQRQSSGDQAAEYIRRLIFDGELPSGARVPQDEIAGDLGMSRIPVREALIALERQGWVRTERHRGAFVTGLDPDAVRDHYELYGLIYGFAARRAIARNQDALSEALGTIVKQLPAAGDDPRRFGTLARGFHKAVVGASHSPRVDVALRSLSALVPGNFFELVPGSMNLERKALAKIQRAIKRGDGEAATTEYADMMRPIGELVVELFQNRGLFDQGDSRGVD
jgi:DNA-binding GntR family transcriptional regulator